MTEKTTGTNRELQIAPSATSSERDFDFLFGSWKVHNRKLKTRLKNCSDWLEFEAYCSCHSILLGFGNRDLLQAEFADGPFEGATLRLFDPATRLWSIYWADSKNVVLSIPVVGSFDGQTGTFFARESWQGVPIILQFLWDKTDLDRPTWSQAFSVDDGQTWEWNWQMTFVR